MRSGDARAGPRTGSDVVCMLAAVSESEAFARLGLASSASMSDVRLVDGSMFSSAAGTVSEEGGSGVLGAAALSAARLVFPEGGAVCFAPIVPRSPACACPLGVTEVGVSCPVAGGGC